MTNKDVINIRLKTKDRDIRALFTKLEALTGEIRVNLDENASVYLDELLKKTIETIEKLKSEQSSSGTTLPSVSEKEEHSSPPSSLLANSCIFRVEFPEEDLIICMRDFDPKGSIHKMPTKACENHWLTQKMQHIPKTYKPYTQIIPSKTLDDKPDPRNLGNPTTSNIPLISSRPAKFCKKRQILIDPKKCEACKLQTPTDYELCQGKQSGLPQKFE